MIFLNILLLSIIVVFIVDISGFTDSLKKFIAKVLLFNKRINYRNINLKPFTCSQCMIFWVGIIYLLTVNQFNLENLVTVVLFSYFSTSIKEIFYVTKDMIDSIIDIPTIIINKLNK